MKMCSQSSSAAVAAATESDAPEGARELQLHNTRRFSPCQDLLAEQLRQAADEAKRRGDHDRFWCLRRQFLLHQAATYSPRRSRPQAGP
jgi:hypothetical protein